MKHAIGEVNNVYKTIETFNKQISPILKNIVKATNLSEGQKFGNILLGISVTTIFATIESNIPKVYYFKYYPIMVDEDSIEIEITADSLVQDHQQEKALIKILDRMRAQNNIKKYCMEKYP